MIPTLTCVCFMNGKRPIAQSLFSRKKRIDLHFHFYQQRWLYHRINIPQLVTGILEQDSIKPNQSSVIESSCLSSGFEGGRCVRMPTVTICICKAFAWMATGEVRQSKQGFLRKMGKMIASPSKSQYWHHLHTL